MLSLPCPITGLDLNLVVVMKPMSLFYTFSKNILLLPIAPVMLWMLCRCTLVLFIIGSLYRSISGSSGGGLFFKIRLCVSNENKISNKQSLKFLVLCSHTKVSTCSRSFVLRLSSSGISSKKMMGSRTSKNLPLGL